MPRVKNGAAEIYYEVVGQGFPMLTFAPKGLMSTCDAWDQPGAIIKPPYDYADEFSVISMDQRNAGGKSRAPITADTGWEDYARDQIAVLDDLGIEKCHLYGQCIGGAFIAKLLQMAPERIASAVLAQPIGRMPGEPLPPRPENFNRWVEVVRGFAEVDEAIFDAIFRNLYGPGLAYSVPREFFPTCQVPTLVLAGHDKIHPYEVSKEIAALLGNNQGFVEQWKEGEYVARVRDSVRAFFRRYSA